jgi:hypothetical protein
MYELSISLYTTLCKIFASHKNYNKLSEAAKLLDNVTILLMKEVELLSCFSYKIKELFSSIARFV